MSVVERSISDDTSALSFPSEGLDDPSPSFLRSFTNPRCSTNRAFGPPSGPIVVNGYEMESLSCERQGGYR